MLNPRRKMIQIEIFRISICVSI